MAPGVGRSCTSTARATADRPAPLNLKRLGATGVIGRLYSRRIADAVLAAGLPVVGVDEDHLLKAFFMR